MYFTLMSFKFEVYGGIDNTYNVIPSELSSGTKGDSAGVPFLISKVFAAVARTRSLRA